MLWRWLTASSGSPVVDLVTGLFLMALPLLLGMAVLFLLLQDAARENRELQERVEQLERDQQDEPGNSAVDGEAGGD